MAGREKMELKQIENADVVGKRVLVRVDFNVAVKEGKVMDSFKIKSVKQTIDYLLGKKAKVAMIAHLGRPKGAVNLEFSLESMVNDAGDILEKEIKFIPKCIGEEVEKGLRNLEENEVLLLENLRFYGEEEDNDELFAKALAKNFDVYVNEAFGVSHRKHASIAGVSKLLPSYAGIWLQQEIENLDKVKNNPDHPATAIIGGAKIETKLPLIKNFENNYEHILVGGKVAVEAIEKDLHFGNKVIIAPDFTENKFDIGPETILKFKEIISHSKTVVWNGPMGKFETPPYDKGTKELLKAIVESEVFSFIGGGESVQALEESGYLSKISFVSTGGGAMLEYLSGGEMPGLEVLKV